MVRLLRRNAEHITGRHMYVKDLISLSQEWKATGARHGPADTQKRSVQRHAQGWRRLSGEQRRTYEARAAIARSAHARATEERIDESRANLAELKRRLGSHADKATPPLLLSGCKLEPHDEARLREMCGGSAFSESNVQALIQRAREGTPLIGGELLAALAAVPVAESLAEEPRPAWLPRICWQREHFASAALVFDVGASPTTYTFVYATQSPVAAYFAAMTPRGEYVRMRIVHRENWEDVAEASMAARFTVGYMALAP